jgi:aryl-alcohol dehydrogenase-like predicted oxidoreductase
VGTRSAAHVDDAVRAVDLKLDADSLARIDEITAGAVTVTGPSPEGV